MSDLVRNPEDQLSHDEPPESPAFQDNENGSEIARFQSSGLRLKKYLQKMWQEGKQCRP